MCMYVYVSACIGMYRYVSCVYLHLYTVFIKYTCPKSLHVYVCMCMYMYVLAYMCIHVYICRPHTAHIYSFMCRCPQQARNIPGGGRQPAGPTQDGHGQQPCHFIPRSGTHPRTHFGALVRAARVGGGKRSPPVQPMGPPRAKVAYRSHPEPRPSRSG